MVKLHIELHDEHYALLEAMAKEDYRDVRQQAAYLIGCCVEACEEACGETFVPAEEEGH